MKKIILCLLLIPALSMAQTKGFSITGTITGIPDGPVKITSTQDAQQPIATGTITNGVLALSGSVPEPALYWIVVGSEQPHYIYLENNPIKISGTKKDFRNIKIEGSASQKDFDEFQKTFNPLIGEINAITAQMNQAGNEKKKEQLMLQYDSVVKKVNNEVETFVTKKSSSFVSPFVIYITAQLNQNPQKLESYYNGLAENIRNSNIGRSLKDFIAQSKIGAIGSDAMDFTQADTDGKDVKLSSFKGKYVLVDFWASWCRPCRIENPNVVKVYNKFKDKNFTVLGISLDQAKDPWIKAIEKDKLTWTNLSDLQSWSNSVAQLYRVQSIPQNFLIGPDGKIVAKDLRGEDLEKKLCEVLGCN
ncbi:MAG: TlpA disulfide reductase family protein [Bacteroidota bacterium]